VTALLAIGVYVVLLAFVLVGLVVTASLWGDRS
jgi:hypothetical protein